MATLTIGPSNASLPFDMQTMHLGAMLNGTVFVRLGTDFIVMSPSGSLLNFVGTGFTYNDPYVPKTGTVTEFSETYQSQTLFKVSNISVPSTSMFPWASADSTQIAFTSIFAGADSMTGGTANDRLLGYAGNDTIDSGLGDDTIDGGDGADYLRGNDGRDLILGGLGNDDINGNKGNDTASGGEGDDWVVGGQDDDVLNGDNGFDIVYGNLGNDTVYGDAGNDWVRGGQGDDVVFGGDGNDWLWGDRGNDTITGGAGADLFHSFSGAGIDRIMDFNYAQGDRVLLDDRTAFTIAQVGGDAVITIGGVDQVVLVGVSAAGLAADAVVYA